MGEQFKDLPQIPQGIDDLSYTSWAVDPHTCVQHLLDGFGEEDMPFESFEYGMVSMRPMQRFMYDQSPLTMGLLNAKIPLNVNDEIEYGHMWPSADCFRNVSPDRTSTSDISSYATQNDFFTPQTSFAVPYGSPLEFSQSLLPYPTTEHFSGGGYLSESQARGGSVSLRELEYEPLAPESITDETGHANTKKKALCVRTHDAAKAKTASSDSYADSGIGSSVRDAESVQPIDVSEEPASDSDYDPSPTRGGKRRRSSASTITSRRGPRRRGHARKDSHASEDNTSTRPRKKSRGSVSASKCTAQTNDQSDDRRPFPCPLASYGCASEFSSKNEWKRHIGTQHIKLSYWRCNLCPPTLDPNDEQALYYNEFNRKDLFTQHLRRMHGPPKGTPSHNHSEYPVNEENLADHQTRCFRELRTAPQQSICLFCDETFEGRTSWEERIEHIGRHLEKDRKDSNHDMLDFATWNTDKVLEQYLLDEGLIVTDKGQWKIGDGKPRRLIEVESDEE